MPECDRVSGRVHFESRSLRANTCGKRSALLCEHASGDFVLPWIAHVGVGCVSTTFCSASALCDVRRDDYVCVLSSNRATTVGAQEYIAITMYYSFCDCRRLTRQRFAQDQRSSTQDEHLSSNDECLSSQDRHRSLTDRRPSWKEQRCSFQNKCRSVMALMTLHGMATVNYSTKDFSTPQP